MTTLFTKDDIKEIASQLLGTSPNHIVLRTRLGFKGDVIECIDKVLFIVQSDNAYSKIVAEGENYKLDVRTKIGTSICVGRVYGCRMD